MANNLSNHDSLIIIGVDEEKDYEIQDIKIDFNRKKTQDLVFFYVTKSLLVG